MVLISLLINNCHPIIFDPTQFLPMRGVANVYSVEFVRMSILSFRPPFDLNAGDLVVPTHFQTQGVTL